MLIIIAFCCLMASAFVSGSEIAYFGLTPQEIEELEDSTQPRDRKALSFIKDSERLLATILISNNLVNITMVVLLTFAISQTVIFNSSLLNFLLQTVFMTFLLLLFGEIFPKLVARGRTLWWVRAAVPNIGLLYTVLSPLAKVMARSTSIVGKIVTKSSRTYLPMNLRRLLRFPMFPTARRRRCLKVSFRSER